MYILDKKERDRYRKQLLRRAEDIQRRLDEVTRAARDELLSIRDQIRALDSTGEIPQEERELRAGILDVKPVIVKKKFKTVIGESLKEESEGQSASLDHKSVMVKNNVKTAIGENLEKDGEHRANVLEHKSVIVKKKAKTVLIVEKQPNYSQSLRRQILFAGYKPVFAATAEGGLRKAKECHPDLILLDIEIPDMDGLRFVSEIRQHPEADGIAIIAISAFPHLKARCLELGCDDFLLKPVRMVDLIKHTRKFLHSSSKISVPLTS